ncbi:unnamed protein product [Symbiodinium sp. KB8]|nr:unnamed protein product [Symbiodinium sp. KB8]
MAKATAGSLTLDVRDGLLLVIARWYYRDLTNEYLPSSGVYEHLLGAIREQPGGGARASAQSVRYVCRQAATRRHGRRGPNSCHGDGDVCDEDLYRHVQSVVFSVLADGGPTEQSALPYLVEEFPNVSLSWRDRCHRTRSVMKSIWQPLNDRCGGLLGLLVTDEKSFARMVRTSLKYSGLFKQVQQEAHDWSRAVKSLSFAMQRFDSLTTPLFRVITLFPSVLKFLCNMTRADVGDSEDRVWSRRYLETFTRRQGGENLCKAAVIGDGLLVLQRFLRLDDRSQSDVLLKAREAMETKQTLKLLFKDEGIFHAAAGDTLLQKALAGLHSLGPLRWFEGSREVVASVEHPDVNVLKDFSRSLYDLMSASFEAFFPNHDHVNAFAALDLEAGLTWPERKNLVEVLASHEKLAGSDSDNGPKLGLFARAFYYFDNPAKMDGQDACRQRRPERSVAEVGRSRAAWLKVLAELKPEQRARRSLAVSLLEKSLALQSGTQSVERFLGEAALAENQYRAQHLTDWNLQAAIKLNVQSLRGSRKPKAFNPDELFEGPLDTTRFRTTVSLNLKASKYGVAVQNSYRDFFGEKKLPHRSLDPSKAQREQTDKPGLGNIKKESAKRSLAKEMRLHDKSISAAVESARQEQPASSRSSSSWEPMVQEMREVTAAREKRSLGSDEAVGSQAKRQKVQDDAPDTFESALRHSHFLAEKKKAVVSATPAGNLVPYVDSKGGVYQRKPPVPAPTAIKAPILPELIKVSVASASGNAVPIWRRYCIATSVSEADVVLLPNADQDLHSPTALEARLWGKRVVDRQWLRSKMSDGLCVCFEAALERHLYLHLHETFQHDHPQHTETLLSSVKAFKRKGRKKCLVVETGNMPTEPKHPRLTYQVVSLREEARIAADSKDGKVSQVLNLEQCINLLTVVQKL